MIGIAGPPDPRFAKELGAGVLLRLVMTVLSSRVRRKARRRKVSYEFLFMRGNGGQLKEISALVDAGAIRPVVGGVFPFDQAPQAVVAAGAGGGRGKVIIDNDLGTSHSTVAES